MHRKLRKQIVQILRIAVSRLVVLCPIQKNKIVFCSFRGTQYSDNPRAISERLHALKPDLEIVWLFQEPDKKKAVVPDYVRCVSYTSFRAIYELGTAKAWVDNNLKPEYLIKRKGQRYMQTWHGDRGPKAVLCDSNTADPNRRYVETKGCDVMLTGSSFGERKLRGAFRYEGDFLKCGCPRNDMLINPDPRRVNAVRSALGLDETCRLVLYAPTFREYCKYQSRPQDIGDIDLTSLLDQLEKHTGEKWRCLLRRHHSVRALKNQKVDGRVIDVSDYDEMNELMLISDILITDYSSSSGDFPLTKRTLILYHPDFGDYSKERSLYFDFKDTPFIIARSQQELEKIACETSAEEAAENCRKILRFFNVYETGTATERAAECILQWFS